MSETSDSLTYLGPAGSFTHAAVDQLSHSWHGSVQAARTVADVVFAVESGAATAGLVPLENSVEGDVPSALDELIFRSASCFIQEDVVVPVSFVLAASRQVQLSSIKKVLSHPHALAQCKQLMQTHGFETEVISSTSEAMARVAQADDPTLAAIGSDKGAEFYGLTVLKTKVEDFSGAVTKIVRIGQQIEAPTGHDKTMIVVTPIGDRTGLLADILKHLADRDVGMTSISSRPLKTRLGEYCFIITMRGHLSDNLIRSAIEDVLKLGTQVKILGCFPDNPRVSAARVGESVPPGSVDQAGFSNWADYLLENARPAVS